MSQVKTNVIINGEYVGTYLARVFDWSCYHMNISSLGLPVQGCNPLGEFWTATNSSNRVQSKMANHRILVDSSTKICDATDLLDQDKVPVITIKMFSQRVPPSSKKKKTRSDGGIWW